MSTGRKLLIASVALNVFLAGALAGGAVWLRSGKAGQGYSLEAAGGRLPDQERRIFRKALREVRRESRQVILDGQQARREAADLLRQPTLDTAALTAALERARNADVTMRMRLEQRIVEFAAASSAEDRAVLAEALTRRAALPPAPKKSP
ncbi:MULTISPECIES: periplasmic heavy metal sensor [unclassified Mesorhizobium]|uniref:periplasmic heavy metal sensor n=1 Tax=unclassified Mesorhizobium TaxID=325217 RepID=UPI00112905D1|nr:MULTISPECIES: periplasmic heavy metal sensor [unclassified Mesorhizobium]MBZ9701076.1 periplasmic heavy metal sensor [Mesorhizobium sp. CO1-1-3]MBZ9947728.1 periplasmic heavy metal sensor [Mesorhizobium sp. BR1-1-11]MBZ9953034.1 periplasmic heavy metal sensor [Mesorhizobium sp. BR1-1-15]MBZ9956831.1 periplasmic heavy metal sensor [Mesorhizobium sp. BR1-1-14]MCA0027704.1 periplasmic heavy metal sensor [Mesorhizobium sp. B263B1A]